MTCILGNVIAINYAKYYSLEFQGRMKRPFILVDIEVLTIKQIILVQYLVLQMENPFFCQ